MVYVGEDWEINIHKHVHAYIHKHVHAYEHTAYIKVHCVCMDNLHTRKPMCIGTFEYMVTWCILEKFEKSSGGIDQSNKLKFSLILNSFTLFGRMLWPLWIPHLRAICAGDLFSFSAISISIGSFNISPFTHDPGDPKGEYAYKS